MRGLASHARNRLRPSKRCIAGCDDVHIIKIIRIRQTTHCTRLTASHLALLMALRASNRRKNDYMNSAESTPENRRTFFALRLETAAHFGVRQRMRLGTARLWRLETWTYRNGSLPQFAEVTARLWRLETRKTKAHPMKDALLNSGVL